MAYFRNVSRTLLQPDGHLLQYYLSGDEYCHWAHDSKGYVLTRDPSTGYMVYAEMKDRTLIPTCYLPGQSNPQQVGLEKNLRPPGSRRLSYQLAALEEPISKAPKKGMINNLVIFISFHDQTRFKHKMAWYESIFNSSTQSSLQGYFAEASYGQLRISTTFILPPKGPPKVVYQDQNPRNYYQQKSEKNPIGYESVQDMMARETGLLQRTIAFINQNNLVPTGLDLDTNLDGFVYSVCFIIQGNSDDWDDLFWAHEYHFRWEYPQLNGMQVYNYIFVMDEDFQTNRVNQTVRSVGPVCHEMGHVLGLPDLYHYRDFCELRPVGEWDLMGVPQDPPQHMGAYIKYRYLNWLPKPQTVSSGYYTLHPLANGTTDVALGIGTGQEYFMLEYRQNSGTYERSLPGAGLLVYRINKKYDGKGNGDNKDPTYPNLPQDEVYIYRLNGTPSSDGDLDQAFLSGNTKRTNLTDLDKRNSGYGYAYLTDGSDSGLDISEIGLAGDTISFFVGR